jgi:hypothetical protein
LVVVTAVVEQPGLGRCRGTDGETHGDNRIGEGETERGNEGEKAGAA